MIKKVEMVNVLIRKELLEQLQELSESTNEIYESQIFEHFVNNILVKEKIRLQKLTKNISKTNKKGVNLND